MFGILKQIITASQKVCETRRYLAVLLLLVPAIAFLLFLIPVKTIPGNDLAFQSQIFGAQDYLMLLLIAILESLLLLMFFYLLRRARTQKLKLSALGQSPLGIASGIPAFLLGTKLCPLCLAGIFGFLGSGFVFSILKYRLWIFAASIIILLLSLYSIAKKINGACEACK